MKIDKNIHEYIDEENHKTLVNALVTSQLYNLCIMVCLTLHYIICKKCEILLPGLLLLPINPLKKCNSHSYKITLLNCAFLPHLKFCYCIEDVQYCVTMVLR